MSGEAASANVEDQMSLPHMGVHTTQVTRCEAYLKACLKVGAANGSFCRAVLVGRLFTKGNYV